MWERCSRAALLGIVVTASGAAALRTLTTVSGLSIPAVGLGTAARINASTVATAIDLGVKLLDTAQAAEWYDEAGVGTGIRMSRRQRDELWITTKVHPRSFGPRSTLARFEQSQMHLNTTYVDALLLHYTCCFGNLCKGAVIEGDWMDAWRVFEDLNRKSHARVIGASNVDVEFLHALWQFADVKPQLVQNRMEPFHQDRAVRAWCSERKVVYQAYSSLGTQHRALGYNPVLESPLLKQIAAAHPGRSVAQVVLQWALQQGVAVIPRSRDAGNIAANIALGAQAGDDWLSEAEMKAINAMDGCDPAQSRGGT